MENKSNKIIWIVGGVFALIVIVLVVFFVVQGQANEANDTVAIVDDADESSEDDSRDTPDRDTSDDQDPDDSSGTTVTPNPTTTPDTSSGTSTSVDMTKFKSSDQTVGEQDSNNQYSLESVTDSAQSGFHRFTFQMKLKSGAKKTPFVNAKYKADISSVRMYLNMTTTDNSGIPYQGERSVSKDGIVKIYHNVSANQTEELYDIGIEKATDFYLHFDPVNDTTWNVILDVKYPGKSTVTIDNGSTVFSQTLQNITGATASDGAGIASYTYSLSGGVLKFIWNVKGSADKPIPTVKAEYDSSNNLIVTFTSLQSDGSVSSLESFDVPAPGNKIQGSRTGQVSTYKFLTGGKRDFKLSASTSPNQVSIEIK